MRGAPQPARVERDAALPSQAGSCRTGAARRPSVRRSRPVRVLLVHGTLEIGGAEEVRLALLACLDRSRYDARVCCLQRGGPVADEAERLGYQVTVLGQRAHAFSLSTLSALRRLIREYRPHIVQTSLPRANYWGRIAAALERVPVIIAEEHTVADRSDWARPVTERLLGPRTDCVIAVSHSVRQAVAARDSASARRRTVVISNPVNAARLCPLRTRQQVRQTLRASDDEILVLHTGRMDRVRGVKAHDILIEAAALLPPTRGQTRFVLLGDGPGRTRLQVLAATRGVADRVQFLGWRRDVADYLAAADLFAFPSRCEGMPIALMEAMWMGLPVIASDIPANREVTRRGRYARLVPVLSPSALAQAIAELSEDDTSRLELGRRAQRHARHAFAPERYARAVSRLWEELLVQRPSAQRRRADPAAFAGLTHTTHFGTRRA